ncbi:response regulator [Paenibacillus endoradicis]|uniref:response regulator n=1 Tax=Paenibacillus endoradicis TaxID=2972487 RepID=UPI002158B0DF|nr:response regulator [Paenibacillus endoradicis]MCR8660001.1 response regulator [Paenibacillus endoradicis]
MNRLSLKTKGIIIIVIISLVPLMIAGLYNYYTVKQDMIQTEIDKVILKQESRSFVTNAWINTRIAEVMVMSRNAAMQSANLNDIVEYLSNEQQKNQFYYDEIGFFDVKGNVTSVNDTPTSLQYKSTFLPVLRGEVVITDPLPSVLSNDLQSYVSVPVFSQSGEIIGAIYVSYKFQSANYVKSLLVDDGNLYLYNNDGNLLIANDSGTINPSTMEKLQFKLQNITVSQKANTSGSMHYKLDGYSFILFYQHIEGTNWIIIEVTDSSRLQEIAAPTLWRIVVSIALAVIIIALLFYVYFESIITRLQDILRVTKLAAEGSFDGEHLDAYSSDEIGNLANSVNGMMGRLQVMFNRLDAVINQNKSPVLVMDEKYYITYLNKAAEEMLGYTSEEVVGKVTPLLFMDLEEVKVRAEQVSEQLGRKIQPGIELFIELRKNYPSYDFELSLFRKDGKRIPVYNRSSSLTDRKGKLTGIIAILTDLSEQRAIENVRNRLQLIVESAMDLIASVDRHAHLIYINEAGKKILGIEHNEWEMQPISQYLPSHLYRILIKGCIKARKHGYFETDAQFQNSNGKHINVSIVIVAHRDSYNGDLMYSCISRDITEQVEIQQKLVQATESAEEASRVKSNFLALMSHEIRTPLNGIIGLSQLLQKTELDALQREYANRMKDSSDMLLNIVTGILDFSKLEVNMIEPDFTEFQIRVVMNHLADQLSVFLGGKDQFEFKIDVAPQIPIHMIGDALRLEQILSNLCVNAIKFTKQGIVELNIEMLEETNEHVTLKFSVKDTGIGMNEEQLEYLFKPFTQADSSTTRKYGGTGLGLVISRDLVQLLGGQLLVESEFRVGSSFTFELPFVKVHQQQTKEHLVNDHSLDRLVWIVEDSDIMADYWNQLLTSQQYSSMRMKTWKQAYYRLLRLGEGAYPTFILLDMEMNDMYGMETWIDFCNEAACKGISIIAITTAYGREELLLLGRDHQPERILTKPVTAMRFIEAIHSNIDENVEPQLIKTRTVPDEAELTIGANIKVLLAEDNKVNQLVAVEMLKHCHCNVTVASNGIEAIACLSEEDYDLVLMDIHMPEMDGMEAVRQIRNNPKYKDLPIIALTANVLVSDHEQYLRIGMNTVVTKPISMEQLQQIIVTYTPLSNMVAVTSETGHTISDQKHIMQQLLLLNVVQADIAIERLNGKVNIYIHMLKQFIEDYIDFASRIRTYLELGQFDEISRSLHTLKGSSSYLEAQALNALSIVGEKLLKDKDYSKLPGCIEMIDYEILLFEQQVRKVLSNTNNI